MKITQNLSYVSCCDDVRREKCEFGRANESGDQQKVSLVDTRSNKCINSNFKKCPTEMKGNITLRKNTLATYSLINGDLDCVKSLGITFDR